MSDRSSQTSFTVSRNLKTTKNHFIEAKIDKLTEFVIPHQTIPTSTWLCMAYHLASTALHTIPNKHHFYFLKLSKYKTYKEESGGTWHIMSPRLKKWRGHVPRVPHQIAPMIPISTTAIIMCKDHHAQWTSMCHKHIFSILITSSQINSLWYCTITNATTLPASTTDNGELVSLLTEARLPENHNVAHDVTNTANKSSFSLSYAVLVWFGCRNNMHRFGLIVSCRTVQNSFKLYAVCFWISDNQRYSKASCISARNK